MAVKLLGAVCIIVASTAMGFRYSRRLMGRYRELMELKKILHLLQGEIKFASSTLEEAFGSVAGRSKEPYASFFQWISEEMKKRSGTTLEQIWNQAMGTKLTGSGLLKEDRQMLGRLGTNLGLLDKETQLQTLALSLEQVEQAGESCYEELPKKMKLYNSLGVLAGVFLVIFLL